jgi:nucleotide-binding universal stress UspA family protein
MAERPLHVLAPVNGSPTDLSSLILPLVASRPVSVTLFRLGEGEILRDASRVFRMRGLPAETVKSKGPPAREIVLKARANRCDLIAMMTHGRKGLRRAVLGSVAEEVLRTSSVPVLLARHGAIRSPWRIVVAALDGSANAERVLPLAARLAKASGTPLRLLRVHGPGEGAEAMRYLTRVHARLERRGVAALVEARRGFSAHGILRYAGEVGADLLCLTTHGRTGLRRMLFGSVAEEVVRRSPCPVLALRSGRK